MRYFISCARNNHGVADALSALLDSKGHTCANDWLSTPDPRFGSNAAMTEAAFNLVQAIRDTELFIFVLPSTRLSMTELGIALASRYGKRIVIWSQTGAEFESGAATCSYYFHPTVTRFVGNRSEFMEFLSNL